MVVDFLRAEAEAAEFRAALVRRGPEMKAFAARRPPDRIDGHERADAKAARGHGARRTEAAFEIIDRCAISRAGGAERERDRGGRRGLEAQVPVGRLSAPVLVAAVEEIEQARARHDRNARSAVFE